MVKIKITFSRILLALLIFILVIGFVISQVVISPSDFGHSGGEIQINISGVNKTLQKAIDDGDLNLQATNLNIVEVGEVRHFTDSVTGTTCQKFGSTINNYCSKNIRAGRNCITFLTRISGAGGGVLCVYRSSTGLVGWGHDYVGTFSPGPGTSSCGYACFS